MEGGGSKSELVGVRPTEVKWVRASHAACRLTLSAVCLQAVPSMPLHLAFLALYMGCTDATVVSTSILCKAQATIYQVYGKLFKFKKEC